MKKSILLCFLCAIVQLQAQSITIHTGSGGCYVNDVVTLSSTTTGSDGKVRNTYTASSGNNNSNSPIRIIYINNRWEIQTFLGGVWEVDYFSTIQSFPNPPNINMASTDWQKDMNSPCEPTSNLMLPVELISFDALNTEGGKIQLNWKTASEKNNDGFDIERSQDGEKFQKIGFVKGNGTAYQAHSYNYIDATAFSRIAYYRLKQVDFDGRYAYSKVISIASEKSGSKIRIYPTTTEGVVRVEDAGLSVEAVSVFNTFGQVVLSVKNVNQIDLSALQTGVYLIQVLSNGERVIEKVFKL